MEGLEMMKDFWKGKRVFITGHTGFKGAWLSLWLQSLGAQITGYSLEPPTIPNLFSTATVESGMKSIYGDIRNYEFLRTIVQECKPEIVFHLAAQSLVRKSYQNPLETYATNIMGTANLLEMVRHVDSIKAIVNVTSDKCYENKETTQGYREDDQLGGYDPYSNSKACAELITTAFRRSFFGCEASREILIATARAGNVIGGGDWAEDRLIPDCIRAVAKGQKVVIRNPNAYRPWQHVLEPLYGYLLLAEKLFLGERVDEGWNFGSEDGDVKSVEWIVNEMLQCWGENARWELDGGHHPHEAQYLKLDCSKAKKRLGWKPTWDLKKALNYTIAWYKAFYEGVDMHEFSIKQIDIFIDNIAMKE